jgi:hypothetical protein
MVGTFVVFAQVDQQAEAIQSAVALVVIFVATVGGLGAAFYAFFKSQRGLREAEVARQKRLRVLMNELAESPLDRSLHAEILDLLRADGQVAADVYGAALEAVEATRGAPMVKQFALEVGRIHYSASREDGQPTVYDEHAIQNDISMRIGGG